MKTRKVISNNKLTVTITEHLSLQLATIILFKKSNYYNDHDHILLPGTVSLKRAYLQLVHEQIQRKPQEKSIVHYYGCIMNEQTPTPIFKYAQECDENWTSHFPLNQCVIPEYNCTCTWFTEISFEWECRVDQCLWYMCKQQHFLVDTKDTCLVENPSVQDYGKFRASRILCVKDESLNWFMMV